MDDRDQWRDRDPGLGRPGDAWPIDPPYGDCPSTYQRSDAEFRCICVLDTGHAGPHVAVYHRRIVMTWHDNGGSGVREPRRPVPKAGTGVAWGDLLDDDVA